MTWALISTWAGAGKARGGELFVEPSADGVSGALARAKGGDVIRLGAGVHGDVVLRGRKFQPPVKVLGRPGARLQSLSLRQCSGIVFDSIHLEASSEKVNGPIIRLVECQNVEMRRMDIVGPTDGGRSGTVDGIAAAASSDILLASSTISKLRIAVGFRDCQRIKVAGNRISEMRTDGVRATETSDVTISNNYIRDFGQFDGDHRDGIQFYTLKDAKASRDIVVEGNRIEQGGGAPMQGIFMRTAGPRFERVLIRGNLVAGGNHNGIAVLGGADGVRIDSNILIGDRGWVRVADVTGLTVSGNEVRTNSDKRFLIEPDEQSKFNSEGRAPKDGGARARLDWTARHSTTPD